MINIILRCDNETAPAKYSGWVNNRKFWFYYKHGEWNFDIYMDDGGPDKLFEGEIGGPEDDDMSEVVAKAIIVYHAAQVFNEPEIEIKDEPTTNPNT